MYLRVIWSYLNDFYNNWVHSKNKAAVSDCRAIQNFIKLIEYRDVRKVFNYQIGNQMALISVVLRADNWELERELVNKIPSKMANIRRELELPYQKSSSSIGDKILLKKALEIVRSIKDLNLKDKMAKEKELRELLEVSDNGEYQNHLRDILLNPLACHIQATRLNRDDYAQKYWEKVEQAIERVSSSLDNIIKEVCKTTKGYCKEHSLALIEKMKANGWDGQLMGVYDVTTFPLYPHPIHYFVRSKEFGDIDIYPRGWGNQTVNYGEEARKI